ncbi:MAG: hypothetical protein SO445_03010 [Lachnospiraceae bacterium]|nr:hypothetical protein [Butyrivibrio sp.]MDY4616671.1 hypothetical protein [Lachnospiraceae bacterium]
MGTNLLASASTMVLASAGYMRAITNLKTVLLSIGSAIGAVMLVYGGIKFAMAFRQMDQQGEHQAVYSVVAGGILVGLSALVTALT